MLIPLGGRDLSTVSGNFLDTIILDAKDLDRLLSVSS